MTTFFVSFLLAFFACLTLTPAMLWLARHWEVVDASAMSHRKVHRGNIPRLGGLAIAISFYVPLVALTIYSTRVGDAILDDAAVVSGLLGGGIIIALLGLYDDTHQASPRVKLGVQITVALALCALGFRIERVDLPFLPMLDLGLLSWPITVVWVVGVTNAVNLIDGLDGLAAGIALFGLMPMMVLSISKGNLVLALVCCCLAGALLGFLPYNFHPARIFMGDTGSMFLGFILAVVSVTTAHKGRVAVAMLTPLLALGMPILDTMLAIARRAWFGQSLFVGDRGHIHHRLLDQGFSHRRTVLLMYGFAAMFAMLGIGVHFNRDKESALLFLISLVAAGVLLRQVGYLVLPGGVGGEMASAVAIRERNRLIRASVPTLQHHLRDEAGREGLARALAEVAFSAGACRATLTMDTSEPVRTWTWEPLPHDADEEVRTFIPRTTGGIPAGRLEVAWTRAAWHESAAPVVEAAAVRLVDAWAARQPDLPQIAAGPVGG